MTDSRQPTAADRERVLDRTAEAMEILDTAGEPALAAFCERLGPDRDAVLARLRTLRGLGLMQNTASAPRAVPERIGDFQLISQLGSGGMGVVYRARQLSLGRDVALKLVRPDQLLFPGVRERFQREVAIVARLQHEGIVRLYSYGEDQGLPWFAMEHVAGVSLATVLQQLQGAHARDLGGADLAHKAGAPTDAMATDVFAGSWVDACVRVIELAAQALAAAHAEGVLHRDLKPSNVMLTPQGRVVLLDFGLAWSTHADRLTRSGAQLGTIHYMAPEQIQGRSDAIDERTDVYALGVVLRELLTLRPAFAGATVDVVAQRVQNGQAAPFGPHASGIGRDVRTVCATAMERDPARRYPTAKALARDLRHLLERRPIAAVPPGLGLRTLRFAQRHRALTVAAGVAATALLLTPAAIAWSEAALRGQLERTNHDLSVRIARESELRGELERSNRELSAQVQRADTNLDLAAGALNQTLRRIADEHLLAIPDLREFCDGVLVETSGFLDALIASNPADPAARFRLARTLAQAAHLRWQFFDLPRTSAVFHRAQQLLAQCSGAPDDVDTLALDVALALIYIDKLTPAEADLAYTRAFERAQRAELPLANRSPQLRYDVARCLARHGELLARSDPPRAERLQAEASALRTRLAAENPSAELWYELAKSASIRAMQAHRAGRSTATDTEFDECDAATERLLASADKTQAAQRMASGWLQSYARQLAIADRADRAATWLDRNTPLCQWLVDTGSSRSDLWDDLAGNLFDRARHRARTGDHTAAIALYRDTVRVLDRALGMWPSNCQLLRTLLSTRQHCSESLVALGDQADGDSELALARETIERCDPARLENCPLSNVCREVVFHAAKRDLQRGAPAAALPLADAALRHHDDAVRFGAPKRMQPTPDTPVRLLRAEILLQLDRPADAVADLRATGRRLPSDFRRQLPSLDRHRDSPALATFLAEHPER